MLQTGLIRPLGELLQHHAAERGAAAAFRDDARSANWSEIERRTAQLAGQLRRLAAPGACVAICMGNRVEAVESYLGVTRAGNVGAYLNPAASDGELAYMLEDCGAQVLLTDAHQSRRTWELAEKAPEIEHVIVVDGDSHGAAIDYEQLLADADADAPDDLKLDDPAWLLYTSGTTGRPKGVVLTQRSCLWVVAACWTTSLGLSAEDDLLSALPLFHSYALNLSVLAVAATGASERLLPRFSVTRTIETLREEEVTVFAGVPTMFHYLVKELDGEPLRARALRATASAGAILPGSLMEAFEHASGVPLLDGYGITETSTMVTINWPTGARPPGSCGLPVPGCAVRLVDPVSGEDVPFGEEGELIVRGPQVMQGYYNNPDATREVLRGGWYHSGDLARSDESGYLTITGRIKELIIRGGENIYPSEVEQVIAEHPEVRDAAVVGIPDEALGEVVLAFVVLSGDDVDDHELREYVAKRLAAYKVPERFERIEAIPRTGSGKVQRHKLMDRTRMPSTE
jgi:acyl-CoA synthetase (AMP-forming)/AMP-acid ligase II